VARKRLRNQADFAFFRAGGYFVAIAESYENVFINGQQ
jgi:hypothetical protein